MFFLKLSNRIEQKISEVKNNNFYAGCSLFSQTKLVANCDKRFEARFYQKYSRSNSYVYVCYIQ